ncbi:MAG: hypothetical protein MUC50_22370 [Myxococcota bacterium]|jgi:hypothetical protein|nr:hypothetical protein [Myxococcota bacterium]
MEKVDLREVLKLVREKLSRDAEAGCGLFNADKPKPTSRYAIGEEDGGATTKYAIGEEG